MQKILRRPLAIVASGCLLLCSLSLLSCSSNNNSSGEFTTTYFVNPDNTQSPKLETELARTVGERSLGLMYRKEIADNYAMLFVFEDEQPRSFWMKNTYVSLDMIFISSKFRVVSIIRGAPAHSTSGQKSVVPAKYVLEVRAGLSERWGVVTGSQLVVEDLEKL